MEDCRPDPGVDAEDAKREVERSERVAGQDPPTKVLEAVVVHEPVQQGEDDRRWFLDAEEPGPVERKQGQRKGHAAGERPDACEVELNIWPPFLCSGIPRSRQTDLLNGHFP